MRGHFQLIGSVKYAAIFKERNDAARAETSSSVDCQDTPPSGLEMPVNRFGISLNFMTMPT